MKMLTMTTSTTLKCQIKCNFSLLCLQRAHNAWQIWFAVMSRRLPEPRNVSHMLLYVCMCVDWMLSALRGRHKAVSLRYLFAFQLYTNNKHCRPEPWACKYYWHINSVLEAYRHIAMTPAGSGYKVLASASTSVCLFI